MQFQRQPAALHIAEHFDHAYDAQYYDYEGSSHNSYNLVTPQHYQQDMINGMPLASYTSYPHSDQQQQQQHYHMQDKTGRATLIPYDVHTNNLMMMSSTPSIASSSMYSDRHNTPRSCSEMSAYSPPVYTAESMYNSPVMTHANHPTQASTINMAAVVQDHVESEQVFNYERDVYSPSAHDNLQRSPSSETALSVPAEESAASPDDDSDYVDRPTIRSRRTNKTARQNRHRINKRAGGRRDSGPAARYGQGESSASERSFCCPLAPYGCRSTFGSKNEWKRHFSTQHLRLGYWRCDKCPSGSDRRPNDFNRKDLFMQHVRRMHTSLKNSSSGRKSKSKHAKNDGDDQEAIDAAERCYKKLRSPPTKSMCVVCKETFSGQSSWEKRMEHLGKHFEDARKGHAQGSQVLQVDSWDTDTVVEEWMIRHGILQTTGDGTVVIAEDSKVPE